MKAAFSATTTVITTKKTVYVQFVAQNASQSRRWRMRQHGVKTGAAAAAPLCI